MVALLTLGGVNAVKAERATKTPLLLLKNGVINTNDFAIAPIAPSTLTADNLYAATFTSKGGYCNTFKYENLDVSGYDKAVVKYTIEEGNGDWHINLPNNSHTALPIGTDQEYEISLKDVDSYGDFTVFSWNHSGKSITISEVYLFKEGTTKILDVDLSKLPAKSENTAWAWNAETSTGTFSWSNNSWNSTELFGAGDYSAYTTLNLETKAVSADKFRIIFKFTNGTGQITIDPVATGTQSIKLADYVSLTDLANVLTIRLSGNGNNGPATGDITVSKVYLEGPIATYIEATLVCEAPAGTTDLNGMTGSGNNVVWNVSYPKDMTPGEGWCGNIDGDDKSVDITKYDYLHFVVTSASQGANLGVRVFVSDEERDDNNKRHCLYPHPIKGCDKVGNWETFSPITGTGTYVVKISDYPLLRGFKGGNSWQDGNAGTVRISQVYLSSGEPVEYPSAKTYVLVGEVPGSGSLAAALADENGAIYDATGVTGTNLELTPANPNAIFVANEGALSNNQNVCVNGNINFLRLTDGHPFKAPAGATASDAYYSRENMNKWGTVCLPYAVTSSESAQFYSIDGIDGDVLKVTALDNVPAGVPALVNVTDGTFAVRAQDVELSDVKVSNSTTPLYGTYEYKDITADDAANYYAISNNQFVQATGNIELGAFRAYFTAPKSSPANLRIPAGETTAIEALTGEGDATVVGIYSANGAQQRSLQKGINVIKLSNGKTQKVLVK